MSDFFFARSQMAMSLAFHIIFAALGIGMPLLMAFAEGMYLRTRQPVYLDLSKRWARGTAILFAVGAVCFMPKMRRGALRRAFGLVGAGIWCMEEPAGFLGGPPGSLKSTHYNPRRNRKLGQPMHSLFPKIWW
jgi:Cytochrome bd terminal oxidase subunit I